MSKTKTETQDLQDQYWKSVTVMNCDKKTEKVTASGKSSMPVVALSKQQNIIPCLSTVLFWQLPLIIAVYQTLARTHNISKVHVSSTAKALMSKCFWSYNYRLITTVQQHENLQLIVALQVNQLWQHVVTHSSPICRHQQTTVAKYPFHRSRGDRQTEDFLAMDAALWTHHCPKSQDRDWDSRDPRPRPRPRLEGSKSKTLRFQDQDRDQDL